MKYCILLSGVFVVTLVVIVVVVTFIIVITLDPSQELPKKICTFVFIVVCLHGAGLAFNVLSSGLAFNVLLLLL